MDNDKFKANRTIWQRVIALSLIVGLAVGLGLWFWQHSADKQVTANTINSRADAESIKSTDSKIGLIESGSQLELVGDKLSEVAFHLREQRVDAASQTLDEADKLVHQTDDDPQLQQSLLGGIKQIRNDLENGKNSEAQQEINLLLNQLNMPEN